MKCVWGNGISTIVKIFFKKKIYFFQQILSFSCKFFRLTVQVIDWTKEIIPREILWNV